MAKIAKKSTGKKTTSKKSVSSTAKKSVKKVPAVKKAAKKAVVKKTSTKKVLPKTKSVAKGKTIKAPLGKPAPKGASELLAEAAVFGILEKKGRNVICMDLRNIPNAVCDYFIICEADSSRQVSAIADSVDFEVKKKTGQNPFHTEGWQNSLWILLDYVDVVVHVFEAETRHFYKLETLWADAEVKEFGVDYL
jgi:ribosome-associated protein